MKHIEYYQTLEKKESMIDYGIQKLEENSKKPHQKKIEEKKAQELMNFSICFLEKTMFQ